MKPTVMIPIAILAFVAGCFSAAQPATDEARSLAEQGRQINSEILSLQDSEIEARAAGNASAVSMLTEKIAARQRAFEGLTQRMAMLAPAVKQEQQDAAKSRAGWVSAALGTISLLGGLLSVAKKVAL